MFALPIIWQIFMKEIFELNFLDFWQIFGAAHFCVLKGNQSYFNTQKTLKGLCTNHVDKWRGRGVAQMSTLLNKSYLVKVSTKGGGGQKCPKFCLRGLYTAP